jgi:PKD repeat protein
MKKIATLIFTLILVVSFRSYSQDWTYVTSTGTTYILYGMSFPPGQGTVGYACGMQYTYDAPGVIVKTTDGGNNWTQIWPTTGEIDGLQAIWFTSDQVGFACGWNNYFIKTTDGGTTWTPITVGADVWYYIDVEFWDSNNGIALAKMNDPGNEQAAFITSNGGTTWVPATSGLATAEVMGLSYATQTTVFVVGTSGNVFRSTDGGHNWTTWATLSAMLLGVDFANANFGVVGGEENIFATNNGGATWTTYNTGYENFYATETFPDGTGYCGGTDENIYKTTNYGASWTMDYNGSGSSSLYRIRWTDTGIGFTCGSQGRIVKNEPPVDADFTANPTTTCVGNQVNFFDNSTGSITSWSWTFQGGTPATSNVPNPVVTYNNAGTFDVQLTVSTGINNSTEVKTDYITVIQSISQPNTPTGETATCGTYSYNFTTHNVINANSYDWQVNPSSAGTITGTDTVGTFTASNTWSGAYTIKVRGVSACGPGPWSSDLNGTLYHDPIQFNLVGDGGYCEGGTGAEISQDGSETGINYELFKDNVTTGNVIPGTGSPISFGFYTETGLYTVTGTNGTHCAESMVGQIYVHMQAIPGQPATPQGPATVCNNASSDYSTSGATYADDYTWTLDPAEAGEVTPNANSCTITWSGSFTGSAMLTVTGVNDCGTGNASEGLLITVNVPPAPIVSGLALVCNDDEAEYSTANNPGSTYEWTVTGGTITSGTGTSTINVHWGNPGSGTVTVTETTAASCQGTSQLLNVTIDDCTGIGEASLTGIRIYPNPAHDNVQVAGLDNARVRIYNLLGKEVMVIEKATGVISLNITNLEKGIYLVKIEQNGSLKVVQLVRN